MKSGAFLSKNTKFTCCLVQFRAQRLLDFVCLFVYFAGESHYFDFVLSIRDKMRENLIYIRRYPMLRWFNRFDRDIKRWRENKITEEKRNN